MRMMPPLARTCLEHLRHEEAAARALHTSLTALRSALLEGDTATIVRIANQHAELAADQKRTGEARNSFRRTAAEMLGVPAVTVTVRRIIATTPAPWDADLQAMHQRLVDLTAQNRELGRRISATLACCRSFTRGILARLTGRIDRYGPNGARLTGVSA
jgi:hypothetical protein